MAAQRLLGLLGALALGVGCLQDDGSRFNPLDQLVPEVDDDAERELGWEFDRALQDAVTVIHDPMVAGFLTDLGQSIVDELGPQPFVYRFRIVEDSRLNAFAVPGGFVYFHTGTLLAASSVDELAGVMGHEIAHVKAHHYARLRKQSMIPDLAAQVAGLAAAIAADEPALMMIAEGINVSMQLKYSRDAETEADQLGSIWMSRAGFDPAGITRFFERILAEQRRYPMQIPPYLFSHPAVDQRIEAIRIQSQELRPMRARDPSWNERLGQMQARLARLLDSGRESLPPPSFRANSARSDPLLAEADRRAGRGEVDAALLVLARAEASEPNDPRVPYRIGELLLESGRASDAVPAFRRTLRLDPSRARVFFKLGRAHAALDERQAAVFAFEQAELRAGAAGGLKAQAAFEVEKLTFPVVKETGFTASRDRSAFPPPIRESFQSADPHMGWWAKLGPHFVRYTDRFAVQWKDPSGEVVLEEPVKAARKPFVVSSLASQGDRPTGIWSVELRLEGDLVHSDSIEVRP